MSLDTLDRRMLNTIQTDFPLTATPYADIGKSLNIGEAEVIHRLDQLKSQHIIRMIGPVIDARRLGFESSLVAAIIEKPLLEAAEKIISEHPGVSHGYERDHRFNVWFTLALAPSKDLDLEIQSLQTSTGAKRIISLPALKLYKIGTYFDMEGDSPFPKTKTTVMSESRPLSQIDKALINELQQDLPLISRPFDKMAAFLGLEIEPFLSRCHSLISEGKIRRFSASINHRQAGFTANAMCCWSVPPNQTDVLGEKLASLPEVSHCYVRKTYPDWPHNLFAMIHGNSLEKTQTIVAKMSEETGFYNSLILLSTKEFKKQRVKYVLN